MRNAMKRIEQGDLDPEVLWGVKCMWVVILKKL